MSNLVLEPLPDLVLLENYKGRWEDYLQALYDYYCEDFIRSVPCFQEGFVKVRRFPEHNGKGITFWHLISEGGIEDDRTPDLRRCERIRWPRWLIEADQIIDIKIWQTYRSKGNQKEARLILALQDFSYVVVLAKTGKGYMLITAYHVERKPRREKLKREHAEFLKQKKGGFAS